MPQQDAKKDSTLLTPVCCQGQQGLRACSHSSSLVHADHFTACTWPCICHQRCQATCSVASREKKKRELRLLAWMKDKPRTKNIELLCACLWKTRMHCSRRTTFTRLEAKHKPRRQQSGNRLQSHQWYAASMWDTHTCCEEALCANLQTLPCIFCIGINAWPANQQIGSESRQLAHTPYSNPLTTTCCLLLVGLGSNAAVHVCKTGPVHQQKLPFISKTCKTKRWTSTSDLKYVSVAA